MGVVGGFFGEGGEEFEGGGVVLLVEGFVGLGAVGVLLPGLGLGCVSSARGKLGVGRNRREKQCGKKYCKRGPWDVTGDAEAAGYITCSLFHYQVPLSYRKLCKVFKPETLGRNLGPGIKN